MFNVVVLDLSVEYFSLGPLYVAPSRVTSKGNIFDLSDYKKAVNIVLYIKTFCNIFSISIGTRVNPGWVASIYIYSLILCINK